MAAIRDYLESDAPRLPNALVVAFGGWACSSADDDDGVQPVRTGTDQVVEDGALGQAARDPHDGARGEAREQAGREDARPGKVHQDSSGGSKERRRQNCGPGRYACAGTSHPGSRS